MSNTVRWLDAKEAAAYLSLSVAGFLRRVKSGRLPVPVRDFGLAEPIWDRLAIDAVMMSGQPEGNADNG